MDRRLEERASSMFHLGFFGLFVCFIWQVLALGEIIRQKNSSRGTIASLISQKLTKRDAPATVK